MESIPDVLLVEILLFLTPKEIFTTTSLVCKTFQKTIELNHFLDSLTKINLRLKVHLRLSDKTCLKILKSVLNLSNLKAQIDFIPVSTDGGADEDKEVFWFGNVFELNERSWCTLENIRNAHASGVLADTQALTEGYYWANKEIVKIVKYWLEQKGQVLSRKNEYIATAIFNHVVTTFPLDAIVIDEPRALEMKETIRKSFNNSRPFPKGYKSARRFPNEMNVCDLKFDKEAANISDQIAVIKYIDISRKGHFTCPVKTLMVFVSFNYIDVLDAAFKVYNDVKQFSDLAILHNYVNVPVCGQRKSVPGFEYCEFSSTNNELKPVVWCNFLEEKRIDELRICLQNLVSGKYFYVKLIQPEDRRDERNWNHDSMNIDVTYVLPRGTVICVNDS